MWICIHTNMHIQGGGRRGRRANARLVVLLCCATQRQPFRIAARNLSVCQKGHLAQNKTLAPLGPPLDPRHRPTVGS